MAYRVGGQTLSRSLSDPDVAPENTSRQKMMTMGK